MKVVTEVRAVFLPHRLWNRFPALPVRRPIVEVAVEAHFCISAARLAPCIAVDPFRQHTATLEAESHGLNCIRPWPYQQACWLSRLFIKQLSRRMAGCFDRRTRRPIRSRPRNGESCSQSIALSQTSTCSQLSFPARSLRLEPFLAVTSRS